MLTQLQKDLNILKNPDRAKILARFFKTGKNEYGYGDKFLGITVPSLRNIAKNYINLTLQETQKLLSSKFHEYRLAALLILVEKFKQASMIQRQKIAEFYIKNSKNINNWDLVDLSAPKILGEYLMEQDKSIIYRLAGSGSLWERRIAAISTFQFIKNNRFEDALKIYEMLLHDKHDLIQKAVGWMLREIGKRNPDIELDFLNKYYKNMPRTMLRYAIERLDNGKKNFYMGKIVT